MKTDQAIKSARSRGLDLIEIAPTAQPPVCRIVDFGKFRYDLAKQEKEKKGSPAGKLKEIKFRVNIDQHDYLTKMRHAEEFLDKGNKLKILLQFRGREMAHQELGMAVVERVRDDLTTMAHVDMPPKMAGRAITMIMSPLPASRRKKKFLLEEDDAEPAGETGESDDRVEEAPAL